MTINFTPHFAALPFTVPFIGPETIERQRGRPFRARLGANESAFGASPKALAAMRETRPEWYGDSQSHDLRAALAERLGVDKDEIVVGAGIDGLLGSTVRLFAEQGRRVVTSLGAYPTFAYHVTNSGAELLTVPYRDDHEDLDALAAAAREHGAVLVYLANPDNPMGTWHPAERIQAMIDSLPGGCVLVLDEAYHEFGPAGAVPPLDTGDARVIRFRTFSKAHGMAGMRIGYAVAHRDLIAGFHKVRDHFGVSRMAQAGALASLSDEPFLASVIERVAEGRADYAAIAQSLGLAALHSATNFVAIDMGRDGDYARAVLQALQDRDVFVRMPGAPGLDRCIRVTVGLETERAVFAEALARVL